MLALYFKYQQEKAHGERYSSGIRGRHCTRQGLDRGLALSAKISRGSPLLFRVDRATIELCLRDTFKEFVNTSSQLSFYSIPLYNAPNGSDNHGSRARGFWTSFHTDVCRMGNSTRGFNTQQVAGAS